MKIRPIHYNADVTDETATIEETTETAAAPAEKREMTEADIEKLLNADSDTPAAKAEEQPKNEAEVKTEEQLAAEKAAAEKTDDAVVDDLDKLEVPALTEDAKEDTWIDVAGRLSVTAPTDPTDFETVEKNVILKYAEERKLGFEEGVKSVQSLDLEKEAPEAIPVLNAIRGGTKWQDILLPLQGFNAALALSPEDRLANYYTGVLKMTPEKAAEAIAQLETAGTLETTDAELRLKLETARDTQFKAIVGEGEKAYQAKVEREKLQLEKETKDIHAAITGVKTFMGAAVGEEHHAALIKKWESGEFKKMMAEDPQAVAEFVYWKTFGKQRLEAMSKKIERDTKLGVIKKQANTPNLPGGTKTKQQAAIVDVNGDNPSDEEIAAMLSKSTGVKFG